MTAWGVSLGHRRRSEGRPRWNTRPNGRVRRKTVDAPVPAQGSPKTGGGNYRGSIFRLLVGAALINRQKLDFPTWGDGQTADRDVRSGELALERQVSQVIGNMWFL